MGCKSGDGGGVVLVPGVFKLSWRNGYTLAKLKLF